MTTVRLPDGPWQVVRRLASERGARVWPVGGAVRDVLLGRPVHDWDFAVDRDALGVARAAADVVTLPVRAVSKGVDVATTSQSEADEKRGREIRKREERLGELDRDFAKQSERCADGDDGACERAQTIKAEQRALMQGVPERD